MVCNSEIHTHIVEDKKKGVNGSEYLFRVLLVICFLGVIVGSKSLNFKHLCDNKQKEEGLFEQKTN